MPSCARAPSGPFTQHTPRLHRPDCKRFFRGRRCISCWERLGSQFLLLVLIKYSSHGDTFAFRGGVREAQPLREQRPPGEGGGSETFSGLIPSPVSACLSPFSQTEVLTPGGSARPTRSTTTGEAPRPGSRSAPAASSATAQTPSTTATATRTTSSGECRAVRALPCAPRSSQGEGRKVWEVLK